MLKAITTITVLMIMIYMTHWFTIGRQENILRREDRIRDQEILSKNLRRDALKSCFNEADVNYSYNFKLGCTNAGLEPGCMLPSHTVEYIEEGRQSDYQLCRDLYK